MHRYSYLLFVSLLFLQRALAQPAPGATIQGRITDAETGEPLPNATAYLPDRQQGSASDASGWYRIEHLRPGSYRVVFSYLGYRNETRIVRVATAGVSLDVALTPTAVEATPITVTAKAQASDLLSTPQAVVVLEGERLAARQGMTAFDALEGTPGVRLLRTGVAIAKPMVRGLSAQRVLVVQNGIRQEGQQWGEEHGPELDPFEVDRIEVVKGPASLLYGSDALGGVIQAASDDLFAHTRPLAWKAAVQGMSNTRMGATHLQVGGRSGRLAYEASGSLLRAGAFGTPAGVVPNTGMDGRSFTARLGHGLARGNVQAEYRHLESRLGMFEPHEPGETELEGGRYDIGEPYQRVAHDRAKLQASLPWAGHRVEFVGTWQQNRRKEFGHHDEGTDAPADEPVEAHAEGEEPALYLRLGTATADARLHHRPLGPLFGTLGLSVLAQRNETLAEEALIPGARTWNAAAYLFEEVVLSDLTLSGGLRLDLRRLDVEANEALGVAAQTRDYGAASGAMGAAWQPHPALSIAANVGRAWRAPVLIELFARGVHEGTVRFERGTPTLRPEQSLSLDGTVRWLNRHLYVEANGFVNQIDDFIFPRRTGEADPASGYPVYQYAQAQARLWGAELTADLHPHPLDWIHLRLSGDVTLTRNLDTRDPLPFSPPPQLQVEAELERRAFGPFETLRFRVGPTFVARQNRVAPLEVPTPGYDVWSLSLSGEAHVGGIRVTPVLALDNVFDEGYVSHLSRFRPFGVQEPGRNLRFQVQLALP